MDRGFQETPVHAVMSQLMRDWPEDTDAEKSVIASIAFGSGDALAQAAATIDPQWFLHPTYKLIFEASVRLYDAGIEPDAISIKDQLTPSELSLCGGYVGIVEALGGGELVVDVTPLAAALHKKWVARKAIGAIYEALVKLSAHGTTDIGENLTELTETIHELLRGAQGDCITSHAALLEMAERGTPLLPPELASNAPSFGVPFLDTEINATPGRLGVIAAKTSAGKSSIAYQVCVESAKNGRHVLLVSLESDAEEVAAALAANLGSLNRTAIMRYGTGGFTSPHVNLVKSGVQGYYPNSGASWEQIERGIRNLHRQRPVDVVIIDYFTLLDPPNYKGRNLSSLYGEISKAAKRLAQQLKCSVILLSQFNRGIEDGQEPYLENLRETGQLEQDADWVVLMWAKPDDEPDGTRIVHAKGAKNRGAKRNFRGRMVFYPAQSKFVEDVRETEPAATLVKPKRQPARTLGAK